MADHLGIATTISFPPTSEITSNFDIIHGIRQNELEWSARSYCNPYIGFNSNKSKQDYHRSIEEYDRLEEDVSTHLHPEWSLYKSGQKHACKPSEVYQGSLDHSAAQLDLLLHHAIGPARRSASLERQVANRRATASRRTSNTSGEVSKRAAKALLNDPRPTADRHVRRKKNKHLRCPELGCTDEFCGRWELERHKKSKHGLEPAVGDQRLYKCAIDDCNRRNDVLARADKIRNHIRQAHPWIDDVEAQVQASAIVASVERKSYIGGEKDEAAQQYKVSNQYLTPPDSMSDRSWGGRKDSASTRDCTNESDTSDTTAERARAYSSSIQQQSDQPSLTACDHIREEIEHAEDTYGPHKVVHGDKDRSTTGNSHPHSHKVRASNSNPRPQFRSATNHAPENVDGDGKEKGRDTATQTAVTSATSTAGHGPHGHHLVPSGPRKRKQRGDEPPPDPPPGDQRRPLAKIETDICGFCCAFYNNPRPCRWTPHSRTCHRFVSELKRFHEMHGLIYCGICFTDFSSKEDLATHERGSCNHYRCFVSNCPDWGKLVESGCPHHSRKNSQEETYHYLLLLARKFREGQDTSSVDLTAGPSGFYVGNTTTPRRGVRSASTVSRGSIAPRGISFDANQAARENSKIATPSVQEGSVPDRPLLSPLQNLSLSPRVNSLERLSAMMWDRLEAGVPGVNENLTTYYQENVSGDRQAPMPPYQETDSQYMVRVLENLARQLWNELRGVSHTAPNELRDRVNDRIGGYLARRANRNTSTRTSKPRLDAPIVWNAFDQSFTDFADSQTSQPAESLYNTEMQTTGYANTRSQASFGGTQVVDNEAMQSNSTTIAPPRLRFSPPPALATARTSNAFENAQQNQQWRNTDGTSYTGTLDVQNSFPPGPLSRLPVESMFVHTGGDYGETSPSFEPPAYFDYDAL